MTALLKCFDPYDAKCLVASCQALINLRCCDPGRRRDSRRKRRSRWKRSPRRSRPHRTGRTARPERWSRPSGTAGGCKSPGKLQICRYLQSEQRLSSQMIKILISLPPSWVCVTSSLLVPCAENGAATDFCMKHQTRLCKGGCCSLSAQHIPLLIS